MSLAESLRVGMRRLASGVCVITTEVDGRRYAMTASSVTSLSDSPASLLVCVNKTAAIQPYLKKYQPFAVNILGAGHESISNKCAQREAGDERFSIGLWERDEATQLPCLKDAQAVFLCEVDNDGYEYGTHQIVIGKLTRVMLPDIQLDPLIYVDGAYSRLT